MNSHRQLWILVCYLFFSVMCLAQTVANLQTAETRITLQALPHAPILYSLRNGEQTWKNTEPESPISTVNIDGQKMAVQWTLNTADSQISKDYVNFGYDPDSPHLR